MFVRAFMSVIAVGDAIIVGVEVVASSHAG